MSSWGKKLETKLSTLTDSASNESIQTLANWIGFNRKHAPAIAETLATALKAQADNAKRQWLYWQLVHELLLLENSNPTKWNRLQDLRTALGETTIVVAIKGIPNISSQVGESLVKEWDEHNVFGGPYLVSQIKRLLTSPKSEVEDTPKTTESAKEETQASEQTPATVEPTTSTDTAEHTTTKVETPESNETPTSQKRRTSLSSLKKAEYDFESKNVPAGKVDSREFLEPCKAIATLQIARDLRNDAPVQLASLLDNLPADIQSSIDNGQEIDEATIEDYSKRIPAKLLDLDMEEQIANIATFQDIVKRQRAARKTLIYLLLKSRCQFGSNQAAKEFLELPEVSEKLFKRKQLLTDALELEGIDTEDIDNSDVATSLESLKALPALSWYEPDDESENTSASKKSRTGE